MQMQTNIPARKVTYGAALGTMLGVIAVWVIESVAGIVIPTEVALAVGGVLNFAVGYMTPPASRDGVVR